MTKVAPILAALTALMFGCKKTEAPAEGDPTGGGSGAIAPGPKLKAFHMEALDTVPASAQLVASLDIGWSISTLIDQNLGLLPVHADVQKLRTRVSRQSKRFFGIDILQARRAVLWLSPTEEAWAFVVEGPFDGAPKGKRTKEVGGKEATVIDSDTFGCVADGKLTLGNEKGLSLALGKGEGLDKDEKALHERALDAAGDGGCLVSGHVGALSQKLPKMLRGLEAAGLAFGSDGTIGAAVVGEKDTLKTLLSMYEEALTGVRDTVDDQLTKAEEDGNGALAIVLTIAQTKIDDLVAALPVRIQGDVLLARSEVRGGAFTSYAAITSTIAVPAFIKYMRRAKTTEAIDELDKIYKASSSYYTTPYVEAGTGKKIDCQFPASQPMTPDVRNLNCCGGPMDQDKDDRCDVSTVQWTTPTWSALNFQMNDQHYFGYEYASSGVLATAKFTASAYADLDCDGVLSTFQRYGYGDVTASAYECSMMGSSAFYKNNETE